MNARGPHTQKPSTTGTNVNITFFNAPYMINRYQNKHNIKQLCTLYVSVVLDQKDGENHENEKHGVASAGGLSTIIGKYLRSSKRFVDKLTAMTGRLDILQNAPTFKIPHKTVARMS